MLDPVGIPALQGGEDVNHWEEKPGAVAECIRQFLPLKPALQAQEILGLEMMDDQSPKAIEMRQAALKQFIDAGWSIDDPLNAISFGRRMLSTAARFVCRGRELSGQGRRQPQANKERSRRLAQRRDRITKSLRQESRGKAQTPLVHRCVFE
jgi:hypothetical protein